MENKAHALMAGIFTIALLIAATLIALWFNRDQVERVPYEIATSLPVPGLNPQAGVRYRGLDVGRVDEVLFDPDKPGQILIRMRVSKDTPITRSTFATLSYLGVTGLAYIQLDDTGEDATLLTSSQDNTARIHLRPGLLDALQRHGLAILQQSQELTARLNTLLASENQQSMLAAFTDVSVAANKVAALSDQLQPTIQQLPALTRDARATASSLHKLTEEATLLVANLNQTTQRLHAPDGLIDNLSNTTNRIHTAAQNIENQATPLFMQTKTTLRTLNRTLENLQQHPQSILFGNTPAPPGPGEPGFEAP